MPNYFEQLKAELLAIRKLAQSSGANGFFAQEVLRFYSIAGTLLALEGFSLDEKATVDERYMTHVLSRSLLENYFWIIYLFDDPAKTSDRYEELKNSFKKDYHKLLNEPLLPRKNELEPADPSWANLPRGLDVNSMLAQVKNDYGDRLNYLYFVYRITSFDTHGKSLGTIFEDVFGKNCSFPVLKIKYAFELVANQYLVVLNDLRSKGVV
jgi:hypothetical protein